MLALGGGSAAAEQAGGGSAAAEQAGGGAGHEDAERAASRHPAHGYDVHAGVRVPAHERKQLERLLRYLLHPALSHTRLALLPDGRVKLRLQRPWRDGTTHLVFGPVDFLARLTALIPPARPKPLRRGEGPPPRVHQVVAHGILAPRAKLRSQVAPRPREDGTPAAPPKQLALPTAAGAGAQKRAARGSPASRKRHYIPWAVLMKRSLELDPLECPSCGLQMRVVASVTSPAVIRELLAARGLGPEARVASPARAPPQLTLPFGCAPSAIAG